MPVRIFRVVGRGRGKGGHVGKQAAVLPVTTAAVVGAGAAVVVVVVVVAVEVTLWSDRRSGRTWTGTAGSGPAPEVATPVVSRRGTQAIPRIGS